MLRPRRRYITDLYETDRAATDPRYNGSCTTKGVCTCADAGSSSNICRYSSYLYTDKAKRLIGAAAKAEAEVASTRREVIFLRATIFH
jgi:hypothetical protein